MGRGQKSQTAAQRKFFKKEAEMGKYLIAWLLGVPVFVLVLFFVFF